MVVERELLNAILKGDASANERYLADTYLFTGPDGTVEKKAQAIADLKSGDLKLQSASLDRAKVQVYGDTAVVAYSSNDKGPYKGKDTSGKTRSNDVFVNQNGLLATLGAQGTMLPMYLASLARLRPNQRQCSIEDRTGDRLGTRKLSGAWPRRAGTSEFLADRNFFVVLSLVI